MTATDNKLIKRIFPQPLKRATFIATHLKNTLWHSCHYHSLAATLFVFPIRRDENPMQAILFFLKFSFTNRTKETKFLFYLRQKFIMVWYCSACHFDKCVLFTLMLLQKFLICRYQEDYNVRCRNVSKKFIKKVFDKLFCNNKYQIMIIKLQKISFYKCNSEKNYFSARYFPIFLLWNSSKGEVGLLQISQKFFSPLVTTKCPWG